MREILFRGKSLFGDDWVEGEVLSVPSLDQYGIRPKQELAAHRIVKQETIGQFTGLTDKNGIKSFEGDIVENNECIGIVEYSEEDAMYTVLFGETLYDFGWVSARKCEVIGNIHDNPELLEGGA